MTMKHCLSLVILMITINNSLQEKSRLLTYRSADWLWQHSVALSLTAVLYLATVCYQQTSERTTLGSPSAVNKAFLRILSSRVITLYKRCHENVERVMNTNGTTGSVTVVFHWRWNPLDICTSDITQGVSLHLLFLSFSNTTDKTCTPRHSPVSMNCPSVLELVWPAMVCAHNQEQACLSSILSAQHVTATNI